jgi:hypothetical protein
MRSRNYFLIRAIILFIGSLLSLFFFPLMPLFNENISYDPSLLGMGLFASIALLVVGFINYNLYKSDLDVEKAKDRKIQSLEKELKKDK